MTEKILNRSNVGSGFQQMGGEGMPQGVEVIRFGIPAFRIASPIWRAMESSCWW